MRVQKVSPARGMIAFADETNQYRLPPGLRRGTRLQVIARSRGPDVCVRDDAGREFTIPHWLCDCGSIFEVRGEWMAPHDPEIRAWLDRCLAQKTPDDFTLAQLQDQVNAGNRELLERWG